MDVTDDPASPYNDAVIVRGPVTVDASTDDPDAGIRTITCPVCGHGAPLAITLSAHLVCHACGHRWHDSAIGLAEASALHNQVRDAGIARRIEGDQAPLAEDLVITPTAAPDPVEQRENARRFARGNHRVEA